MRRKADGQWRDTDGGVAEAPALGDPCRIGAKSVLTQLIAALVVLERDAFPEARIAVQLLMDTGRRPGEICALPLDCLDRDPEGKYLLVYDDAKTYRRGRRLPIQDSTGELIVTQQHTVRACFPESDPADLALLPTPLRNPHGTRRLNQHTLGEVHRRWVDALPDLHHTDGGSSRRSRSFHTPGGTATPSGTPTPASRPTSCAT